MDIYPIFEINLCRSELKRVIQAKAESRKVKVQFNLKPNVLGFFITHLPH